ncbi:protein-glutamate O-methyltransferase CheR [bacterium]|nr:protein-glutamate O-methyltransferase CheR [bacterium]
MNVHSVTDAEFRLIQKLIYEMAGVYIKEHKKTMVANRLRKRLENYGFESYKKYYDFITRTSEGRNELIEFVNCLTTNETFFFRHGEQLDLLVEKLIPERLQTLKPKEKLRIWSAACSSGEEPYSIAILMHQKLKQALIQKIEIHASDINMEVLDKAQKGIYKPYALQKVNEFYKRTYFRQLSEDKFQISNQVQSMVHFFRHNLLNHHSQGPFDIVLCRNVMIYFDQDSKTRVLSHLFKSIKPGGFLITGYAESLFRVQTTLKYIQPTLYQKES